MTTLHMDVGAVRGVQRQVIALQSQLDGLIQSLNNAVMVLPAHWQANSADEFFGEYDNVRSTISSLIDMLGEVASELSGEISAWEEMAEKFS